MYTRCVKPCKCELVSLSSVRVWLKGIESQLSVMFLSISQVSDMSQECGTSHQAVKSFANSQPSAKIHPDPPQHTTGVWKVKDSTLVGDADVLQVSCISQTVYFYLIYSRILLIMH